ncbi:MAG: flagellar biosynthetic protein FliQ, partial [Candidatus Eremiobacteraeota bacterium]|nr:flagellar biosynthetic protein FliQ [Candidatus Eremiobacteraeota bacterium]
VALPLLGLATAVGTVVAVMQAATQIQEQTLTLLPKLLAVGAAAAVFGEAALRGCARLFEDAVAAIPAIVRGGP